MKHQHSNRILSRTNFQRSSLLKNLTSSLLKHGSITTTEAKGKELRRFFEPLVTLARLELTLHRRRQLLQQLGKPTDLPALLVVATNNKTRPGGYLRLTKLPLMRSDAASMVKVDILGSSTAK